MKWPWVSRKRLEDLERDLEALASERWRLLNRLYASDSKSRSLQAENDDLRVELAALKMIHQNEHQFAEHLG